jgi:hypothetical protein
VVIDAELGKEDHSSIPTTAIERELEPFDDRTNSDQIKLVVKVKKKKSIKKKLVELHFDYRHNGHVTQKIFN